MECGQAVGAAGGGNICVGGGDGRGAGQCVVMVVMVRMRAAANKRARAAAAAVRGVRRRGASGVITRATIHCKIGV